LTSSFWVYFRRVDPNSIAVNAVELGGQPPPRLALVNPICNQIADLAEQGHAPLDQPVDRALDHRHGERLGQQEQ
jgi:hypothetical protein